LKDERDGMKSKEKCKKKDVEIEARKTNKSKKNI